MYEVLQLLQARGWRQKLRVGQFRMLEHPERPGVYVTLVGRPREKVRSGRLRAILRAVGIEGELS